MEVIVVMRIMASLIVGYMLTAQALPIEIFHQMDHAAWADRFADVLLYGIADHTEHEEPQ